MKWNRGVNAEQFAFGLEDIQGLADVIAIGRVPALVDLQNHVVVIDVLASGGHSQGILLAETGLRCNQVGHVIVKLDIHGCSCQASQTP